MNDVRSLLLSDWAKSRAIDLCLVSEATTARRSEPFTNPEHQWAQPMMQRSAGAGMLLRRELVSGHKVRLVQDKELAWSTAIWQSPCGILFLTAYLRPESTRDATALASLLTHLEAETRKAPRCIIGGDFNARTGVKPRRVINEWADGQGFRIVNQGVATHRQRVGASSTDLDLLLARGVSVSSSSVEDRGFGHFRQCFEVESSASAISRSLAPPQGVAWHRLSDERAQARFQTAVAVQSRSMSVHSAILDSAVCVLGLTENRARVPLPRKVREQVRALRRRAKSLPPGTPAHAELVLTIGAILRRYRVKSWQKKVRRLAASHDVTEETWRLVRQLRKPNATSRAVGVTDKEVASAYAEVYGSNTLRRPDWQTKVVEAECTTPVVPPLSFRQLDGPFSAVEVVAAMKSLPPKKAPGVDGIPHEAYRTLAGTDSIVRALGKEATDALRHGYRATTHGRLVVIPKKGPPAGPLDMRPLMMLPTERKLLEKMVSNRIRQLAELRGWDGMHQLQAGFRKGMSIQRQLLLAEIAICDARARGKQLHIAALDIVKAFDTIPKEFVVHCAINLLKDFCPRLAGLIASLTLSPLQAHVGRESFEVRTGVPQGGLLSPWLFIAAMNDLALRIGNEGYSLADGTNLGTLLYADDTLLLDESSASSQERCRLAKGWVEEWGGRVHPGKTGWLAINSPVATHPLEPERGPERAAERSIEYLGMLISSKGVRPLVPPAELFISMNKIRAITRRDALTPAAVLQIQRTVAWPKVSLGFPIAVPDVTEYVRKWHRVARNAFDTFDTTHGVEVQRELGLLNHPLYWACRATVKFYGNILSTSSDPLLRKVAAQLIPGHPLRCKVEDLLLPSGVTWEELGQHSVADLLRKVTARVREWSRREVMDEARRLGIFDGDATSWKEMTDGPALYLYDHNARYGWIFRMRHFGPSNKAVSNCQLCGAPGEDRGSHLIVCAVARRLVPLPAELQGLAGDELHRALTLSNQTQNHLRSLALEHLGKLWHLRRKQLRGKMPHGQVPFIYEHNRNFFRPRRHPTSPLPVPRPRVAKRTRLAAEMGSGADPPSKRSNSLTAAAALCDAVRSPPILARRRHPPRKRVCPPRDVTPMLSSSEPTPVPMDVEAEPMETDSDLLTQEIATSSESEQEQILPVPDALILEIDDEVMAAPSQEHRQGKWQPEEDQRLLDAIGLYGIGNPKTLAEQVGTRTGPQCASRMRTQAFQALLRRHQGANGSGEPSNAQPSGRTLLERVSGRLQQPVPPDALADLRSFVSEADHSPVAVSTDMRTGKWDADETKRLIDAVLEVGLRDHVALAERVRTRTALQCSDRLRAQVVKKQLAEVGFSDTGRTLRWTAAEIRLLESAINTIGDPSRYVEIAEVIRIRKAHQVADKIRILVSAGRLRRQDGLYRIFE